MPITISQSTRWHLHTACFVWATNPKIIDLLSDKEKQQILTFFAFLLVHAPNSRSRMLLTRGWCSWDLSRNPMVPHAPLSENQTPPPFPCTPAPALCSVPWAAAAPRTPQAPETTQNLELKLTQWTKKGTRKPHAGAGMGHRVGRRIKVRTLGTIQGAGWRAVRMRSRLRPLQYQREIWSTARNWRRRTRRVTITTKTMAETQRRGRDTACGGVMVSGLCGCHHKLKGKWCVKQITCKLYYNSYMLSSFFLLFLHFTPKHKAGHMFTKLRGKRDSYCALASQ